MSGVYTLTVLFLILLFLERFDCFEKCSVHFDLRVSNGVCNISTPSLCNSASICKKQFKMVYLEGKPFRPELIEDLLRTCCGPCVNTTEVTILKTISEVSPTLMKNAHFVFPVLGRRDSVKLYGYRYIPIIDAPSVYYITHKSQDLMKTLILSCLAMWPFGIICTLMVLISGFVCWSLETLANKGEFPRTFLRGWFEGIWWSFISMTTVGYGDKIPRTIIARLFAIGWIVIGITLFSIVTAMLTSEIFEAHANIQPPDMMDSRVGVIRDHSYETILVADNGGILIDVPRDNITDGIHKLVDMLHREYIDGFVLDRYELMLFYDLFKDDPKFDEDVFYLRTHTILTPITHTEQHAYGLLVADEEHYEFLSHFMISNWEVIKSCTSLFLNSYSRHLHLHREKGKMFSTKGELFWPSFTTCAVTLLFILMVGGLYEWMRNKIPSRFELLEKRKRGNITYVKQSQQPSSKLHKKRLKIHLQKRKMKSASHAI